MKTQIKKNGNTIIVSVDGRIDYETQENLRSIIKKTDRIPHKIIFNFENLEFVGSSGISNFVQTLKDFSSHAPVKPRFCSVGSEFQCVIKAFDEEEVFEFYDTEERAIRSYDQNN
jgi:anti-anti-sigma factor